MGVPHDGAGAAALANGIGHVTQVFFKPNPATLADLERDSMPLQEISVGFSELQGFDIITVMESKNDNYCWYN
jgi:hypothetical protein